jgi:hypothetical protein
MNDSEFDRLIARANPYGDRTVRHLPTDGAELDLLEDIISTEAPESTPTVATVGGAGPRRRRTGRRRAVSCSPPPRRAPSRSPVSSSPRAATRSRRSRRTARSSAR